MLSLVLNQKVRATLLASDFPTENPRTQNRTLHTQNRLAANKKQPYNEKNNFYYPNWAYSFVL